MSFGDSTLKPQHDFERIHADYDDKNCDFLLNKWAIVERTSLKAILASWEVFSLQVDYLYFGRDYAELNGLTSFSELLYILSAYFQSHTFTETTNRAAEADYSELNISLIKFEKYFRSVLLNPAHSAHFSEKFSMYLITYISKLRHISSPVHHNEDQLLLKMSEDASDESVLYQVQRSLADGTSELEAIDLTLTFLHDAGYLLKDIRHEVGSSVSFPYEEHFKLLVDKPVECYSIPEAEPERFNDCLDVFEKTCKALSWQVGVAPLLNVTALVLICLLGVAIIGVCVYFIRVINRKHKQRQQQHNLLDQARAEDEIEKKALQLISVRYPDERPPSTVAGGNFMWNSQKEDLARSALSNDAQLKP